MSRKTDDGIPQFVVRPDLAGPDTLVAACPVMDLAEPLLVFANVTYDTGDPLSYFQRNGASRPVGREKNIAKTGRFAPHH